VARTLYDYESLREGTTSSIVVEEFTRLLRPLMAEVLVVCIDDEDVREGVVELAVDLGGQGQLPFNSSNRIRRTTIAMLLMMIVTKRAQSNQQTNTRESTVVELYNIKK